MQGSGGSAYTELGVSAALAQAGVALVAQKLRRRVVRFLPLMAVGEWTLGAYAMRYDVLGLAAFDVELHPPP